MARLRSSHLTEGLFEDFLEAVDHSFFYHFGVTSAEIDTERAKEAYHNRMRPEIYALDLAGKYGLEPVRGSA